MSAGRYHFGGWSVVGGEGAGRLASVHEAWHDRLQFTTIYGLLVQHLWAVGTSTGDVEWTSRGDDLLLGARRTHEEYAALMTEVMAGDLLSELRSSYVSYAAYSDAARNRLGPEVDDYDLLHRVSAVYRSCMQPAGLMRSLDNLEELTATQADRTTRPDHRLQVLTKLLKQTGWPTQTTGKQGPQTDAIEAATWVVAPRGVQDYADEPDATWEPTNGGYYDWCKGLLDGAGCETLPYNGQLAVVNALNEAAVTAAGGPIRLVASVALDDETDADVALGAFESETLAFEPSPAQIVLDSSVAPSEMVSGRGEGRHAFLTIRPAHRAPQGAGAPSIGRTTRSVAALRSSRSTTAGRSVFTRPVTFTEVEQIADTGTRIIVNASMMSLSDPEVHRVWGDYLSADRCIVLADLSLARHVRLWASDPAATVTYGVGEYQADGRRAICVGVCASTANASSRLYLAVVSPAVAAAFQVWIGTNPQLRETVLRADGLLDDYEELLTPTMGHLLAEEPFFDFKAGSKHADLDNH